MKVKLAYIQHERCGESAGGLYVFIPEDWDKGKLREIVDRCVLEHIKEAKDYNDNKKPPNAWARYNQPNYSLFPDLTVKEAKKEWDKMGRVYKEWEAATAGSKKSFSSRLKDEGVISLYDVESNIEVYAEWGHHHGLHLQYEHAHLQQDMVAPSRVRVDWDGEVEISEYA